MMNKEFYDTMTAMWSLIDYLYAQKDERSAILFVNALEKTLETYFAEFPDNFEFTETDAELFEMYEWCGRLLKEHKEVA